jgi:hypothetical protein
MPDVQEVFRMATQKIRPDEGFVDRQLSRQRRQTRNRRLGALALAAVIGIVAVVVVIRAVEDPTKTQPGGQGTEKSGSQTGDAIPMLPVGSVEPGRYAFSSSDPALDATYEIAMNVPNGFTSVGESAVLKDGSSQTSASTLAIEAVYVDPCRWQESATLDQSTISSTDGLVAALSDQEGLRVSAPTAVTLDGFAGTYLERRVPKGTIGPDCDLGEFHLYRSVGWGDRWLDSRGQTQQLWILDIEGVPLVIDASVQRGTSAIVKEELLQMVESVQIQPRRE